VSQEQNSTRTPQILMIFQFFSFFRKYLSANDIYYHPGGAGRKFRAFGPKDRRLAFFHTAAG